MGARRPKSARDGERTRDVVQGPIFHNFETRWWKRTWAKVTAVMALIAALLGAPALINSFVHDAAKLPGTYAFVSAWVRGDKHFSGEWTNDLGLETEGDKMLGPPLTGLEMHAEPLENSVPGDQGSVSLELNVQDGIVTGRITSREIRKNFIYSHLRVSGVVRFRTLYINVWDYIWGTATPIAGLTAHWKKAGDVERLEFTTAGWLFPKRFYVERGTGPKPSFNLELVKQLMAEAKRAKSVKRRGAANPN